MEKLNNLHVQRADMNRLIMNYLVTGRGVARVLPLGHPYPFLGTQSGLAEVPRCACVQAS